MFVQEVGIFLRAGEEQLTELLVAHNGPFEAIFDPKMLPRKLIAFEPLRFQRYGVVGVSI